MEDLFRKCFIAHDKLREFWWAPEHNHMTVDEIALDDALQKLRAKLEEEPRITTKLPDELEELDPHEACARMFLNYSQPAEGFNFMKQAGAMKHIMYQMASNNGGPDFYEEDEIEGYQW